MQPLVHPGMKKTKNIIMRVCNWPDLHNDVAKYIRSCLACQRVRPGIERLQGMMRQHPLGEVFERVYMDLWEARVCGEGLILLTLIDFTTKWAECEIIPNKDAHTVASAFIRCWISRFGVPAVIITDQGAQFTNNVFKNLCTRLGLSQLRTTVRHPEGNAPIESFHRVLAKGFTHFQQCSPCSLSTAEQLSLILMSYRTTIHL